MAFHHVSDEECIEAVELARTMRYKDAAEKLGIARSTFCNRLAIAAKRGLDGKTPERAPHGFEVRKSGATFNSKGEVTGRSVGYGPEAGGEFETPTGHRTTGVSALLDPDGNVKQQWVKTKAGGEPSPEEIAHLMEAAFAGFKPQAPKIDAPENVDRDTTTVYVLTDWHIGMFAWGEETGGPDYDLSIARRVLISSFADLLDRSPPSSRAIVLGLGDLMHTDNSAGVTPASGNALDFDTRYAKCVATTCEMLADVTSMVARKHDAVEVSIKSGNHDRDTTAGLRCALHMYWRNSDRVHVDMSPAPFYFRRFGVNLIGGVHGDGTKLQELPLLMAVKRAEDWSGTRVRHWHTGHLHHQKTIEDKGVIVHQHRAPIPADAWHDAHGYLAGRSMRSFVYHLKQGFRGTVEVELLDEKFG